MTDTQARDTGEERVTLEVGPVDVLALSALLQSREAVGDESGAGEAVECSSCRGRGVSNNQPEGCSDCYGRGVVPYSPTPATEQHRTAGEG